MKLDFNPRGYFISEKHDGFLSRWDGAEFWSSGGKRFNAPEWFTRGLPKRELIGELWAGRGNFTTMLRVWRTGEGWERVRFAVFDVRGEKFPAPLAAMEATPFAFLIPQVLCTGRKHFEAFFNGIVAEGGEGVMIRRNCFVEKVKPEREDSFLVVGFSREGSALIARHGVDCGKVALHGDFAPFGVGAVIDVKFHEWTARGKLRHAAFVRSRPDKSPVEVA